jgi:rubrerythrin
MSPIPAGYPASQTEAFALLAARSTLSIDDLKVLALLETAGEAFYLALAEAVPGAEAKALLARNGQEERGHAHRLLKAITLLGGAPYALPDNADNPYVMPLRMDGVVNADFLAMLARGEQDGDLLYQSWAAAESNAEVAKIYRQNGAEETRHSQRVARVTQLLSAQGLMAGV